MFGRLISFLPSNRRRIKSRHVATDLASHSIGLLAPDPSLLYLAAIGLLVSLVDEAEQQVSWPDIAQALGTTPTEVQMRFDGRSPAARGWLHS